MSTTRCCANPRTAPNRSTWRRVTWLLPGPHITAPVVTTSDLASRWRGRPFRPIGRSFAEGSASITRLTRLVLARTACRSTTLPDPRAWCGRRFQRCRYRWRRLSRRARRRCQPSRASTPTAVTSILSSGPPTFSRSSDRKSTRLNSSHLGISYAVHRHLHSFPTRRSSDLGAYSVPFNNIAGSTSLVRAQIPALSLPLAPFVASGTTPLPTVAGFDPDRRDIYTEQWTANVQQELRSEEHTSELQSLRHLVCRPPPSTLFPYTTLFRSWRVQRAVQQHCRIHEPGAGADSSAVVTAGAVCRVGHDAAANRRGLRPRPP